MASQGLSPNGSLRQTFVIEAQTSEHKSDSDNMWRKKSV